MWLKCVRCGATGLKHDGTAWKCGSCEAKFPVIDEVPRFVGRELYTESIGFQWNRFARTQLDSASGTTRSRDTFVQKTGWSLNDLRGKRVLDAGCGMGRFAEVCADAGAEVHAVDLSTAVEAAFRNLGHRPNIRVYQADIMNLPFPEESFDFIYSIGVLHHTPSTKAAFLNLPALLKSGGAIAIWVYSRKLRLLWGGEILRKLTLSMPKSSLLKASKIAIPMYQIHRIPLVGMVTSILLPTSMDSDPQWRWLDTFDWYSPEYQSKHTYPEVFRWFQTEGLIKIRLLDFPVAVSGTKPRNPLNDN